MVHKQFAFHLDRPEICDHLIPMSIDDINIRGLAPEDIVIIRYMRESMHAWK